MLIGFSGKLGVGKSYYTKWMVEYLRSKNKMVLELAFADQIKVNVLVKNKVVSREDIYSRKTSESRKMLQLEGTEKGRDVYGEDYWNRYLDEWMFIWRNRGVDYFVISDVRFPTEVDFIKKRDGIVIRIEAPDLNAKCLKQEALSGNNKNQNHISETALDDYNQFTVCLKNSIDFEHTEINKKMLIELIHSKWEM